LCSLVAAGCSQQPAADPSAKSAAPSKALMQSQADKVEAAKYKTSEAQAQLLAQVEKAKTETTESRVPGVLHDAAAQDEAAYSSVRVYGCSSNENEVEARMAAEMVGRQMLLFARGAEVTCNKGSLKINSQATIPGARVTEEKVPGGYTVVALDASIKVVEPQMIGSNRFHTLISKTAALNTIIQTISQNVEDMMSHNDKEQESSVTGFVVLKKMELVPNSNPLQCNYELAVYTNK
jgi:hypothetical protein